ncbi:hypothetical protein PMAN_a1147 [Pseudoalteromonas marina]|nr:hypothetical protein PMAN_a1147 [Pseudoalteromonas marina]
MIKNRQIEPLKEFFFKCFYFFFIYIKFELNVAFMLFV